MHQSGRNASSISHGESNCLAEPNVPSGTMPFFLCREIRTCVFLSAAVYNCSAIIPVPSAEDTGMPT